MPSVATACNRHTAPGVRATGRGTRRSGQRTPGPGREPTAQWIRHRRRCGAPRPPTRARRRGSETGLRASGVRWPDRRGASPRRRSPTPAGPASSRANPPCANPTRLGRRVPPIVPVRRPAPGTASAGFRAAPLRRAVRRPARPGRGGRTAATRPPCCRRGRVRAAGRGTTAAIGRTTTAPPQAARPAPAECGGRPWCPGAGPTARRWARRIACRPEDQRPAPR
ncbi:hypothetical protein MYSI104531_24545 [Mycobacterium simiae]